MRWLWRQCLLREPAPAEVARLVDLVRTDRAAGASAKDSWTAVANVLMNLDEFVTKR